MSKQKGYYLDEESWGELARVAATKAISVSELIEKYVLHGLAHEVELTSLERYHAVERNINLTLTGILSTLKVTVSGDIQQKIDILSSLVTGISVASPLRHVRKVCELSLFEVLNEIKTWDNDRYQEIMRIMGKHRYLRQEYLTLYPEK